MKNFFKELFEYNHHFNQKLWTVFNENQDKTSAKAIRLYNHILNAHQIWNSRVKLSEREIFGVWELHSVQELKDVDSENYKHTLLILDMLNLNTIISYTNTKGDKFQSSIQDIFFHVINHSTYHRAQIATEFVQIGLEPIVTDYIFYKR
jgi:uncharacterized damage-inducible protein DinB